MATTITIAVTDEASLRDDHGAVTRVPSARYRLARICLGLGAITIPTVFVPSLFDVFARPKTIALEGVAAISTVTLALFWRPRQRRGWPRPVLVGLAGFVGAYVVATAEAVDRGHSIWGEPLQLQGLVPTLLIVVVFVVAFCAFQAPAELDRHLLFVAIGAAAVASYAIGQRLHLDPIWDYLPSGRVFSSLGQANALAAYLVSGLLASVSVCRVRGGLMRKIFILVAVGCFVALVLTLSRAGYIALVAGAAVLVRLTPSQERWRIVRRWLPMLALSGAVVFMVAPFRTIASEAGSRALSTTALTRDESIEEHVSLWHVGLAMAADHLLIGVGPDNYVLLFDHYRDRVLPPGPAHTLAQYRPESPHNVFIARLDDGGVGALVSYVLLLSAALLQVVRRANRTVGLENAVLAGSASIVVAHLVTDWFMTGDVTGTYVVFVVLGASLGVACAGDLSSRRGGADHDFHGVARA